VETYLVTGGAGFIGSNLARGLVAQGCAVRVLDNLSTGRRENLDGAEGAVELIKGDINSPNDLGRAMEGVSCVFHLAAQVSVVGSVRDPAYTNRTNVGGTLNVLLAAREAGVRRMVCSSSCAVYGNSEELPKREDMPLAPSSPYAVSKACAELYVRAFSRLYDMEVVVLRYFNVYGPYQSNTSRYAAVIPRFIAALAEGRAPIIHGDGRQSRDFVCVSDVVNANLLAAAASNVGGEILNVGSGQPRSILEVAHTLGGIMGTSVEPRHAEARAGDIRHSHADISKAERLLGYRPSVTFDEGLERTITWFRQAARGATK
jgi:nucleoside-diphosphate-sugar epimerase